MIIDQFTLPKVPNLPQQVEINRRDIEELKSYIRPYYKCTQTLSTSDELVARTYTNVPEDVNSGFLVDATGKLFEVLGITGADNVVIDYWAQLTIGG